MSKGYYTYRICVNNNERVQIERYNDQRQSLGRSFRKFGYPEKQEEIKRLLEIADRNELEQNQSRQLGEVLFDSLFDPVLRQDFLNFYFQVVQEKKQLLRIELDIDEQEIPEISALPWEFLRLPKSENQGTVWLATDPNLVFSRRRALWNPAKPIQLAKGEKLRIALAISAPKDLKKVEYAEVQEYLEALEKKQSQEIELLPIVNPATPTAINELLEKEPHIFHFIGHGCFVDEQGGKVGKIALVRKVLNKASWVDAEFFAGLFVRHRPGIVVLQACEGGMQSASEAFRGVAAKIVAQNIPVVVAMQYEIANATASVFSCEFYRRLAKGEPVDIAAQNSRNEIALETQYKNRGFATPVIFMRVEDGYLFTRELVNHELKFEQDSIEQKPRTFTSPKNQYGIRVNQKGSDSLKTLKKSVLEAHSSSTEGGDYSSTCQLKYWDCSDEIKNFVQMLEQKNNLCILGIMGPEKADLSSFLEKLESICEEKGVKIHGRIQLMPKSRDRLAREILEVIKNSAIEANINELKYILEQGQSDIDSSTQKNRLSDFELSDKLNVYLEKVVEKDTIVLFLQDFHQLGDSDIAQWLRDEWLLNHAYKLKRLVVVITGANGLDVLKNTINKRTYCLNISPLTWKDFQEWAQAYGFQWCNQEIAKQWYRDCDGNVKDFKRSLKILKDAADLGVQMTYKSPITDN